LNWTSFSFNWCKIQWIFKNWIAFVHKPWSLSIICDYLPLFDGLWSFFLALLSQIIFSLLTTKLSSNNLSMIQIFVVCWFDLDFNDPKSFSCCVLSCFWSDHNFLFCFFISFLNRLNISHYAIHLLIIIIILLTTIICK